MRSAWIVGVGAVIAARGLGAQGAPTRGAPAPAAPAAVATPARLAALADSLGAGASRTAPMGAGAGYTYALTRRDSSGGLEVHAGWTDVFVVQTGSATLLTGGVAAGARETAPGEWRGGTARGATRAAVRPGDVVVIPAGTPHQMLLAPGERIAYLAVKLAGTAAPAVAPAAR